MSKSVVIPLISNYSLITIFVDHDMRRLVICETRDVPRAI